MAVVVFSKVQAPFSPHKCEIPKKYPSHLMGTIGPWKGSAGVLFNPSTWACSPWGSLGQAKGSKDKDLPLTAASERPPGETWTQDSHSRGFRRRQRVWRPSTWIPLFCSLSCVLERSSDTGKCRTLGKGQGRDKSPAQQEAGVRPTRALASQQPNSAGSRLPRPGLLVVVGGTPAAFICKQLA